MTNAGPSERTGFREPPVQGIYNKGKLNQEVGREFLRIFRKISTQSFEFLENFAQFLKFLRMI
jgi:hypothetical protein